MRKDKQTALLCRISGELEGLLSMPLLGHRSPCADVWRGRYVSHGLNFAGSTDEAATLRALVAAGYMESTGGKTKASAWRLTWAGLMATQPPEIPASEAILDLATLVEMKTPAGVRSGLGDRFKVVYGYRLAPSAVDQLSGKGPEAYTDEIGVAAASLFPLVAMGWVHVYVDCSSAIWAVAVTQAGHDALDAPPDTNIESGTAFDYDVWEPSFEVGLTMYSSRKIPPEASNEAMRRLSTGGAWEGLGDKSKATLKAELKAARKTATERILSA